MEKVIAYLRVSTDGQCGEDRFGLEAQEAQIKEYCEKKNYEIVKWCKDEGVSGADAKRPALDEVLNGEIEAKYIVVAKTDRIARDISIYYGFKSSFDKIGIEIISVSEDWSAQDKLTAMILENFMAVSATIERENIRIRTSGGRKQKAKQGGYAGGRAPMGYKVKEGQLVINEEEAKVVRFVFERKFKGETMLSTVKALNEAGYKTRNGKEFVISTVQSIWNNERTYRGDYKYGNGDWTKGVHEPILKSE